MPPKVPFTVELSESDRMRVRISTSQGNVLHFTVQYETNVGGDWAPVVRCDSAHGQAHMDYMDMRGRKVAKTELGFFFPFDDALQWSLKEISANWMRYKEQFFRRKGTR